MDTSMATRTLMKRTNSKIDLTLDYHAHVLPGCDHGSDSVETSRKQLAMAAAARVRTVCATPHFYPHKESIPSFLQRREASARLLRENLTADAPQLQLGAEVLICDGMERLDGLPHLCRSETNELLLEMPFYQWPEAIWDTLYALCERRDIKIVLAHAERYPARSDRAADPGQCSAPAQFGMPDKAIASQTLSDMDQKRIASNIWEVISICLGIGYRGVGQNA